MSGFVEKLREGKLPSEGEWTEHLIETHSFSPGMTPRALASYKTQEGLSSYETLAKTLDDCVGKSVAVMDLGCGDGYLFPFILARIGSKASLVGVDMSGSELAIAKTFPEQDSRVILFCSRADTLPVPDQSIDIILSHMSFMLMVPIAPVVKEISRVLKPGGRFTAVVANPLGEKGLYKEISHMSAEFVRNKYPQLKDLSLSDKRVYSDDGLEEIFQADMGFIAISGSEEFSLHVKTSPQGVWRLMRDMYHISLLRPAEKEELQNQIESCAASKAGDDGKVEMEFPLKKFTVHKR
jgi:ubiquinone/menaquinone biosynthesis C-methylase UbiE